jgi:sirohydrochlorin cobaltochelatase
VVEQFPFPRAPKPEETCLFLAGHGTSIDDHSRRAIEHQVELIDRLKVYAGVHAVFLEEEPRVGACYELAKTKHIVVVPFLISDGMHGAEDIPTLLGEPEGIVTKRLQSGQPGWRNPTERHGKLVWCSSSVGSDPRLVEIAMARVREAARWNCKPSPSIKSL